MRVFKGLQEFYPEQETVVTVCTFDGIHLGHRQLIAMVNEIGQSKNLATTILTFEPHPKTVVQAANQKQVELLTNLDEKLELLHQCLTPEGKDKAQIAFKKLKNLLELNSDDKISKTYTDMQQLMENSTDCFDQDYISKLENLAKSLLE